MDEKERTRALGATLGQIEKQFGKGSIIRLGAQAVQAVPCISTGSISVDYALGVGGFPAGEFRRFLALSLGQNYCRVASGR